MPGGLSLLQTAVELCQHLRVLAIQAAGFLGQGRLSSDYFVVGLLLCELALELLPLAACKLGAIMETCLMLAAARAADHLPGLGTLA